MDVRPTPPEGLRPAQLGIVLVGRAILGHVSATLADLAQRGWLGLEETEDGADRDWLMADQRGGAGGAGNALLDFERTLLDGLFDGKSHVRMAELGEPIVPSLNRMRAQLRRDAVRHGWLRRWGRDKRTPRGEQLVRQIHAFRRDLRTLAAAGDTTAAGLAPYAMIFGLASAANVSLPAHDTARAGGRNREDEIAWAQGDRLTQGWAGVCGRIPAKATGAWTSRPDDFMHAWSAPHGHEPSHGHGHISGHGENYGGYTGHSGHVGGGGHAGH